MDDSPTVDVNLCLQFRRRRICRHSCAKLTRDVLLNRTRKLNFTFCITLFTFFLFLHSASCLEEIVCGGFDMRNSPSHFLSNNAPENVNRFNVCTVIEGDVRLILMTDENVTMEDFEPVRFPRVKEITGSLMVFQVTSLRSLEYLFPELRVIRGSTLVHNYALVLFQNPNLREVGLPNLVEISRGGVRIVDNPELCYAKTVNWTEICRDNITPPFIDHNQSPNICADRCHGENCLTRAEGNSSITACWNFDKCQHTCPKYCHDRGLACNYSMPEVCCHPECIGGCQGPTRGDCYACKNVYFKNECISECPAGFYKVLNRRCITKEECINRKTVMDENQEEAMYKALDFTGTCELKCPENYEENPDNRTECVPCSLSGGCTKKCVGTTIQSLSDAEAIKGCNIMAGQLDITMHSGLSKNVVEKLEEYLGSLRDVRDYVKISFSPSLVSLSMLKNLRVVRGEKLWNEKYAISVFENVNLAQLWNFTYGKDRLQIFKGTLQFHNNPQLCHQTIDALAKAVNLDKNITEHDVSPNSNGNKAVCEELEISLKFVFVSADSVVLNWEEFNTSMMDHRMFLGYQLYYKIVDNENVNIFENRDACTDSWSMVFYDTEERGALLTPLKPYTLYAFYVRTLMVNSPGAKGGISKVVFTQTKFDPPSSVILMKIESPSNDSIYLEWEPPLQPNGEVTHYMISYIAKLDILPNERDYCNEPIDYNRESVDKPIGDDKKNKHETSKSTSLVFPHLADSDTCAKVKCCECGNVQSNGSAKMPTDDGVFERAAFENTIHNIIFVNNRCTNRRGVKTCPKESEEGVVSNNWRLSPVRFDDLEKKKPAGVSVVDVPLISHHTKKRKKRSIDEFPSESRLKLANGKKFINVNSSIDELNFTLSSMDVVETTPNVPLVVNQTGRNFTIKNLKHYTSYEIKIWACQNNTIKDQESYCSRTEVTRLKRTQFIEIKDAINETSIRIENVTDAKDNSKRKILWSEPADPNGMIVGYMVEYMRDTNPSKKGQEPNSICISLIQYRYSHGGCQLSDLMPGNYSLRIRALSLAQRGPWTTRMYFVIPEPYKLSNTIIILVSICCSAAAVGVAVFVVICFYRRRFKKKLPEYFMSVFSANPEYISQLEVYKPDHWELKREDIELQREIGRGTFGTVYKGNGKNILSVCGVRFGDCAVKTVGEKATIYDRWHFLIEASVMKQFNTAYIVKLFGVVSEGQPALVVMELMGCGNLKEYLVSRRPDSELNIHGLSPPTLREVVQMAGEIADGMAYLEAMKFCHRDLAARNCMVAFDGTCKIGDFGMARDVYIKDYYRPLGRRLMPVRWMAPEALKDATFTSKSDVWSYGIILWEISTLASQPYPGLSTEDVFNFVVDSHRVMEMPVGCPQRLYDLMLMCWKYDARDRVSFADIVGMLLPDLNDTFKQISYYCTQRGKELSHRSTTTPSTKLSPGTVNASAASEKAAANQKTNGGDSNMVLTMDDSLSRTPIADGILTDSDAELPDPVCNNNRRSGLPKSPSSPNWDQNRRNSFELPLTPSLNERRTSNGALLNNDQAVHS